MLPSASFLDPKVTNFPSIIFVDLYSNLIICKQRLRFCFLATRREVWPPLAILFCLFIQVLCWFPTMSIVFSNYLLFIILKPYRDRPTSKSLLCLWVAFSFPCPGLRDVHLSLSFHGAIHLPCLPDVVKGTEGVKVEKGK